MKSGYALIAVIGIIAVLGLACVAYQHSGILGSGAEEVLTGTCTATKLNVSSTPVQAIAAGGSFRYINFSNEGTVLVRYTVDATSTSFTSSTGGFTIFPSSNASFIRGENLFSNNVYVVSPTSTNQQLSVLKC